MRIVRTVAEMTSLGGGDLGFVPTMGAFHEGHLSLMRKARERHESVCVSLFVNPLQFGPTEDLGRYPRNEERDFELAVGVGVDIMFAPPCEEIYPRQSTHIHVPEITDKWEGRIRPGHFDGVTTVVAKLFNIVRPRVAYFGWKDLQQCLVIKRMVEDLDMPVVLCFHDTVREHDGLAMSSRNAYLTPDERRRAPLLQRTLREIGEAFRTSRFTQDGIESGLERGAERLAAAGFSVDYLDFVDLENMNPLRSRDEGAVIVAARIGSTRLIDNLRLHPA